MRIVFQFLKILANVLLPDEMDSIPDTIEVSI